jgi:hypothetical protein
MRRDVSEDVDAFFKSFWSDDEGGYIYGTLPGDVFCWVEWSPSVDDKCDWAVGCTSGEADSFEQAKIAAMKAFQGLKLTPPP